MVGAGRPLGRALQPRQLAVVLAENGQRVGRADPRVVGHLVVAHEGRVADGYALDDVRREHRDVEIAHHDRDRGPDQRVGPAAMDVRRAFAALAARGPALARHVGQREPDRAQQAVGVGEVGEQVRGVRAAAVADRAHRDRAAGRVAGEHVAAARAAGGEQAVAAREAALELGGVARVVGDERAPRLLLVPAERGHVPVAAEQQPGLARARLAGEVALPADQLVAARLDPPRDRRRVPVPHRRAQHLLAETVDLEQDHARGRRCGSRRARDAPACGPPSGCGRRRRSRAATPASWTRARAPRRSRGRSRKRARCRSPTGTPAPPRRRSSPATRARR